jgi:N-acetylglucosamine-6-phosphate deacetylase
MRLGVQAALVGGELVSGDVDVEDGLVAGVGLSPAGAGGLALPGFVDLHVNGFAGVDFLTADADGYARAAEALAATGVVAFQPTFVSSAPDATEAAVATAASLGDAAPGVVGVHLEGPFLSPSWPGAHDPRHLLEPDRDLASRLLDPGGVTTMTLAPELPGGLELVDWLTARGVVVSCGHSDADADTASAAFGRGARAITHVYNAHRRWQPRDPGLAGVALVRPGVTVQAIADNVHLAPETMLAAYRIAGERFCVVTDAIEAAGLGDGSYRLGELPVDVNGGEVRLPDGTLAGSVLSMDGAVRNLVAAGATLPGAVHAAATAPARLLGRDDLGALAVGSPAHLAVLDDRLEVVRTLVAGQQRFSASG